MASDLSKILSLLTAQQTESKELALSLLCHQEVQLEAEDAPLIKELINRLSWYFNYFHYREEPEIIALKQLKELFPWLQRSFGGIKALGAEKELLVLLAKHFLIHTPDFLQLHRDWNRCIDDLYPILGKTSWLNLLHYSGRLNLIEKGLGLWDLLKKEEVEADHYLVWEIWLEEFIKWQDRLKTVEERIYFIAPVIQSIKKYLAQQSQLDQALENILTSLWNRLGRLFVHTLLDEAYKIVQLPAISEPQRNAILLQHPIFEFSARHLERIGGMPPDDEYNLFDLLEEDVAEYAEYFGKILASLNNLSEDHLAYLKVRIYDAWSYYYLPELVPYLKFIQKKDPEAAAVYFYLAQANAIAGEYEEAIDHYMRFISLSPLEMPDNHFFISEMRYAAKAYAPSVLEAIRHIGYIYEHELQNEERALYYYQQSIKLNPLHHQAAYWEMIKYMVKEGDYSPQLLKYVKTYVEIIFVNTEWLNPKDTVWNIIPDIDHDRRTAIAWKEHLAIYDKDFKRKFGYDFLKSCLLSLLWELAEHFQQLKNYELSFEATMLAKQLYKQDHIRSIFPDESVDSPFEVYPVSWEDILYLQANNIMQLQKDYWQARMLFKQILKSTPSHQGAKSGLKEIKKHLGY
jgi:hypothetical protein